MSEMQEFGVYIVQDPGLLVRTGTFGHVFVSLQVMHRAEIESQITRFPLGP